MRLQLAMELGREPSETELEAAREAALNERLKGKLGRPPNAQELEEARERAIRARLTAQNGGREPTEEELAAARDAALRQALIAKLGREPTAEEMEARKEAGRKLRLKCGLGDGGGGSSSSASRIVRAGDLLDRRVAAAQLRHHLHELHLQQLRLRPSPRERARETAQAAINAAAMLGCQRPASRAPVYRHRRVALAPQAPPDAGSAAPSAVPSLSPRARVRLAAGVPLPVAEADSRLDTSHAHPPPVHPQPPPHHQLLPAVALEPRPDLLGSARPSVPPLTLPPLVPSPHHHQHHGGHSDAATLLTTATSARTRTRAAKTAVLHPPGHALPHRHHDGAAERAAACQASPTLAPLGLSPRGGSQTRRDGQQQQLTYAATQTPLLKDLYHKQGFPPPAPPHASALYVRYRDLALTARRNAAAAGAVGMRTRVRQ